MNQQRTAAVQQLLEKVGCSNESIVAQESREDMQLRIGTLSMHLYTRFTKEHVVFLKKFGTTWRHEPGHQIGLN
jgi:hypothetical protein